MSKKVLGFYRLSDKHPTFPMPRNCIHEISVGNYDPDGGCEGEFIIEFHDLAYNEITPRLNMFNDSWRYFTDPKWKDFFQTMSDYNGVKITYQEMLNLLKYNLGFKDLTKE